MNKSSFPTIRMVNTFQVEKENHKVVLDVERELENVVIQLRTSDLPSYHLVSPCLSSAQIEPA